MAQAQLPFQQHLSLGRGQIHLQGQRQPDWDDLECQRSLKLVLKWEIQNLIQRLSDAGEEALILTANISEDSTQVLGSENGEQFVLQSDLDLLKQQFLKYCRVHCKNELKKFSPGMTEKRKTVDITSGSKRQKKVLHHIIRQEDPDNSYSNHCSPLRDDLKEEKDSDVCGSPSLNSLASSLVPNSKGNSSRRKQTPKRVVPSLPASQSDSDTDDLDLETIVKVEVGDDLEDLYGEGEGHEQSEDFKSDYFYPFRGEDRNGLFDPFKNDEKNDLVDCLKTDKNDLMDVLKSGNLSDDSTAEVFNGLLNGSDLDPRKDPVLSQIQSARKASGNDIGEYHKNGNLSDDSSAGFYGSVIDSNGFQNHSDSGKELVKSPVRRAFRQCRNGSLGVYTNMESDSDQSGLDGLPTDVASLPDTDMSSQDYVSALAPLTNSYTGPGVKMKAWKKHALGLSKKGSQGTNKNNRYLPPEEPNETAMLDQARRGVRKYECPMCRLMVRDRHDLKRHLLTHTKEKPYKCEKCDKKFTRKWDQKNHIKKHEEAKLREARLAKESEYQVKQNINNIRTLARQVEMQKHALGKAGLLELGNNEDLSIRNGRDGGRSYTRLKENGDFDNSPVKKERNFVDDFT